MLIGLIKVRELCTVKIIFGKKYPKQFYYFTTDFNSYSFVGSPTKNLAPQAIPIFQPGGDKIELKEPANNINDNEKEDKPALSINCEMTENGKNIKKYLESVVKTPLKYVR